jgi:hypothetical protein
MQVWINASELTGAGTSAVSAAAVAAGGTGYAVGNTITLPNGVVLTVATLTVTAVATVTITNAGSVVTQPANPVAQISTSGTGTGATFNLTWLGTGEKVYIHWWAPDGAIVQPSAGIGQPGPPAGTVVLTVADQYVETTGAADRPHLLTTWRNDIANVINAECQRRIVISFPEYMQRNATLQISQNTLNYGSTSTTWPTAQQAQLTEAKRGWDFIALMRTTSDSVQTANPVNPVDDSHWPAQLATPIYVATS